MSGKLLFSRSGNSSAFGKCDDRIDIPIPSETKEALTAMAFAQGIPAAEYARNILLAHVHGHAAMMRAKQIG